MLYDFLVVRQLVPVNPTASVRGPTYVVKHGKTPVWSREDAKKLLESIPRGDLAGLRDRALISTMLFSFARVSAVLSLKRQDFYYQGPRRWLRFMRKAARSMKCRHTTRSRMWMSTSLKVTFIRPALNRYNAWAAIRKRARNAGFLTPVGCHTWRATGVTVYLENGGRLEHAQQMDGHESPRTTKLYDRTKDEITIGEVERIQL